MKDQSEHWHLDKRVPLALIITLIIQTMGVFFWMGQLSVKLHQMEKQSIAYIENHDSILTFGVRIQHIEEAIDKILEGMDR
jgi:hypothetical protein